MLCSIQSLKAILQRLKPSLENDVGFKLPFLVLKATLISETLETNQIHIVQISNPNYWQFIMTKQHPAWSPYDNNGG